MTYEKKKIRKAARNTDGSLKAVPYEEYAPVDQLNVLIDIHNLLEQVLDQIKK